MSRNIFRSKKKSNTTKNIVSCTAVGTLIIGACIGNLKMKEWTNNKPLEIYVVDELTGKEHIEKQYAIEASMYKQEIEKLKNDIDTMRSQKVSRGELERHEKLQQDKVIQAIQNNLKGVFSGKAEYIFYSAKQNQVNPLMMASIIKHETTNGSSKMVTEQNNPGGITRGKGFATYTTLEQGIDAMARLLKTEYIDKGFNTIESIQKKYCPVGADNDPTGINQYWTPMVTKNYIKMLQEAR